MDSDLLARCKSGDPQAIEDLVHEHQAKIYRLCLSMLDDAADAEDATQESFIAALKALKTYRGDSAFHTWLFSIALNVCRSSLRQRKRRTQLGTTLADPSIASESSPTPEQQTLRTEGSQALWVALNKLDEKHRLPIFLRYYHDLSTAEIAKVLRINQGTVHSRLSIARTQIAGELKRAQRAARTSRPAK
ncbi:MAG: RNA polymerase sigma factor [Chloroflexi bacterium]|nr:RNA polymerase sigma factor [Chloroflexota bacterium]